MMAYGEGLFEEYRLMNLEEKTVTTNCAFAGEMLHLYKDVVELPGGGSSTREYVRHVGAVAIVPVTEDGCVIMETQYRYPVRSTVFEIPAGKLDTPDEDRLAAAKRELREETGYTADEWVSLGDYCPAPAYCDEVISLYMASGLHKGSQELDEDEFLEVQAVPLSELVQDILHGKITDGKTQTALLKAAMMQKCNERRCK